MTIPKSVQAQINRLYEVINKNERGYISTEDAAYVLDKDIVTVRTLAELGGIPGAYCVRPPGKNRIVAIEKAPFWAAIMKDFAGLGIEVREEVENA